MIDFVRKGTKIDVVIDTSIGWQFTSVINCTDEPYAILLRQNIVDKMYSELTRIRQEAYNEGWRDKLRHTTKKTWFRGVWK